MNQTDLPLLAFATVTSAAVASFDIPVTNPAVKCWHVLLDATTLAFNGTVVFQFANLNAAMATWNTLGTLNYNGISAAFTQPAAFAGSGIVSVVFSFPVIWRLNCTAFTSGTLNVSAYGI